jgi:hypothetical protein
VRLEGLGKLKKSTSSGIRSRDLPACSVVPQPTTLPRTPSIKGWDFFSWPVGTMLLACKEGRAPWSYVYIQLSTSNARYVSMIYLCI